MEATIVPKAKVVEEPMDWGIVEAAGENVLERFREDLRDIGLDIELFTSRFGKGLRTPFPRGLSRVPTDPLVSPLDLEETPNQFEVRMNLPGVPKDLVSVRFLDQTLEIEAQTKATKETERKHFVLKERAEAEFHRRVSFPTPVAPEKTVAKLDHGVLVVDVPKLKPAKELRVPVV